MDRPPPALSFATLGSLPATQVQRYAHSQSTMKVTQILFEPLPIARIGVEADTTNVVFANDYSCFGKMLEEYISHGAISIVIPTSSPESKLIDDMPPLR